MYSNKEFYLPENSSELYHPENNFGLTSKDGHCKSGNIKYLLRNLPKIKAKPDFEQKMAARFAMELDEEITQCNKSWLTKSSNIRLPEIISDFNEDIN